MFKIIFTDRTEQIITASQEAEIMEASTSNESWIKINNTTIKLDSISRIEPYNSQPDMPEIDFSQPIFDKIKPLTELQEKWLKVIRANSKLLKAGLLPKYTIVNGKIVEKEYYWR